MHVRITDRLDHLVKVWITADYLQIPRLQNSVVDEIEQLRAGYNLIPVAALCQVYKHLPSQAALRKLIFEQCWRFCATAALAFANDQDIFLGSACGIISLQTSSRSFPPYQIRSPIEPSSRSGSTSTRSEV